MKNGGIMSYLLELIKNKNNLLCYSQSMTLKEQKIFNCILRLVQTWKLNSYGNLVNNRKYYLYHHPNATQSFIIIT